MSLLGLLKEHYARVEPEATLDKNTHSVADLGVVEMPDELKEKR